MESHSSNQVVNLFASTAVLSSIWKAAALQYWNVFPIFVCLEIFFQMFTYLTYFSVVQSESCDHSPQNNWNSPENRKEKLDLEIKLRKIFTQNHKKLNFIEKCVVDPQNRNGHIESCKHFTGWMSFLIYSRWWNAVNKRFELGNFSNNQQA